MSVIITNGKDSYKPFVARLSLPSLFACLFVLLRRANQVISERDSLPLVCTHAHMHTNFKREMKVKTLACIHGWQSFMLEINVSALHVNLFRQEKCN